MKRLSGKFKKLLGKEYQETSGGPGPSRPLSQAFPQEPQVVVASNTTPGFPDGIKMLHDCPSAALDVCFIHGLGGDRETTWSSKTSTELWPQSLLPDKLSDARILTYGYDAYVLRTSVASTNRLLDHATNFLNKLTTNRAISDATGRPLVIIAHSLGGLVCKEAILSSRDHPEAHLRDMFDSVVGIIFMGTPHRGSWMAEWAERPARLIGVVTSTNASLLEVLQTKNQYLESIGIRFLSMLRKEEQSGRVPRVTCFREELPVAKDWLVVPKESAILAEGHNTIGIRANHRNMVKFESAEDDGFVSVLGELLRWKNELDPVPLGDLSLVGECLRSLDFPQREDRRHDVATAELGTCEWLIPHAEYQQWVSSDRGMLWIKGKPGSGKSTALKFALEKHSVAAAAAETLVLSFFLHARGDHLQKSPSGLYRSLLCQALQHMPASMPELLKEFKRLLELRAPDQIAVEWKPSHLQSLFRISMLNLLKTRPIVLFIDALDESGEDNAVDIIAELQALIRQSNIAKARSLHVCFSCRHYPIARVRGTFQVCLEDENRQDIATYVRTQLSGCRPQNPPSKIPDRITDRANGVFLWAQLVVRKVMKSDRRGDTPAELEQAINGTPQELDDLYLELIQDNMDSESLRLFQWICCAVGPLSLSVVRWAMVVDADQPVRSIEQYIDSPSYVHDDDLLRERVQARTRGLAKFVSLGPWDKSSCSFDPDFDDDDKEREVLQFIHESVREFFITQGFSALDSSITSSTIGTIHERLTRTCFHGLRAVHYSNGSPELSDIMDAWITIFDIVPEEFARFSTYITEYCWDHAQECDRLGICMEKILESTGWPSSLLLAIHDATRMAKTNWSMPFSPLCDTTLVDVASTHGMAGLLKLILRKMADPVNPISASSDQDAPLLKAITHGHVEVAKLLIESNLVEVDVPDAQGQTPLSHAAERGVGEIVRLLLNHNAVDINSKDFFGRTPLFWAARPYDIRAARTLFHDPGLAGIDVDGSSSAGNHQMIRLLLDHGAVDVNSRDNSGRTPLSWATGLTRRGFSGLEQSRVISALLSAESIDADAQDNEGRTPLSWAAQNRVNGHTFVKLLLDSGSVDVNATDLDRRTPLRFATHDGSEETAELLKEAGGVLSAWYVFF